MMLEPNLKSDKIETKSRKSAKSTKNSYIVLGNDGAHFNQAINSGTNSAVSEEMADALHAASDHLPVFADFQFPSGDESDYHIVISEVMPNPSAVSDSYGEWFEIIRFLWILR